MDESVTTSIGSLPYTETDALNAAINKFDIPAVPEIREDGFMHERLLSGRIPVLTERFKERVAQLPVVEAAKIQCIGPITTQAATRINQEESKDKIVSYLNRLAAGLEVKKLYVFLDEPSLEIAGIYGASEQWAEIYKALEVKKGIRLIRGLHTCGDITNVFCEISSKSVIDIVAFNATQYPIGSAEQEYDDFRDNGGKICWGIVDPRPATGIAVLHSLKDFEYGDLLSTGCGLLNTTKEQSERTIEYLLEQKREILDALVKRSKRI